MRRNLRLKAWLLLAVFVTEIFLPANTFALGSGPSQPEMASFTPAGTTEMVDPFTGDFSYNIPLMDVEGYPINIAYNSGITMEQEASWVGLGWNLNVGSVNRSVRGLPDDFNGDVIKKEVNMKPMKITKVGVEFGAEAASLIASKGRSFIYNNYKGFGIASSNSVGVSFGEPVGINAKVGLDINSLDGTSVNTTLGVSFKTAVKNGGDLSFGGSAGTGYNTRTGQSMLSLGTTAGYNPPAQSVPPRKGSSKSHREANGGVSTSLASATFLPIGMNSYTPNSGLKIESKTTSFSATVGGELWGVHTNGRLHGSFTEQALTSNFDNKNSFGFLYAENATTGDLKDFNRERQIEVNKTITNLSPVNFTYDVFNVTGNGAGGMFRPFRNDIGNLNDPEFSINANSSKSYGVEIGIGAFAHGGLNKVNVNTEVNGGIWEKNNSPISTLQFKGRTPGSSFENYYFKAAGEKTESDIAYFESIGGLDPISFKLHGKDLSHSLVVGNTATTSSLSEKSNLKRAPRAKVFTFLNAEDAAIAGLEKKIYSSKGSFYEDASPTSYSEQAFNRVDANRKAHHISEITQINTDGSRFIYGIPAYNLKKIESSYTTDQNAISGQPERIPYSSTESSKNNTAGKDNYVSKTTTPAYAHSFLLTSRQSVDYQDVTGDGISPDDLGNAHRFNYRKTSSQYKWRVPYSNATYSKGFNSDLFDNKGSYTYGEKEVWYVHSVESKNQVAEFYISERLDGLATRGEEGGKPDNSSLTEADKSFQLDSIILYNKFDRINNKSAAIPIKKVAFDYDYSLCENVPNHVNFGNATDNGKLTLKKIEITYGLSERGKENPYLFSYSSINPDYNEFNLDRWGNYKAYSLNPAAMRNGDFPYVLQTDPQTADEWASAWHLTEIISPMGAKYQVYYESDDYGYVQNKIAMQMYPVIGSGKTTTHSTNTELFNNPFIYIERPDSMPTNLTDLQLRDALFGDNQLIDLYFKFLVNINSTYDEYVSGYTNGLNVGYCPNDDYLYIQLADEGPNPISKTAWNYFRQNLFEILYDQPNINDGNIESVIKGMKANIADITQLFNGVEEKLEKKKIANDFQPNESFIRLYSWNKKKIGGGSRVKKIIMNDSWDKMVSESENSIYGQEYTYETVDENNKIISSGVATYEPFVGNDENSFKSPVPYISSARSGHIPAIDAYQETPFGETFFPTASVGYSEVNVKSINYSVGKTSKAGQEHKFYTAKDFPVQVKYNDIQKLNNPSTRRILSFPYLNNEAYSSFSASQGYSIILNDMHGKPYSTINYIEEDVLAAGIISKARKDISGQIFNYKHTNTAKGKVLSNEVEVLTADGYLENKLLGVEYDIIVESQFNKTITKSAAHQVNVEVIPAGIFPFPTPFPFKLDNINTDIKEVGLATITKTIQMYGILESVESFTDQYSAISSNEVFDGLTGEPILVKKVDEYNQELYEFNMPSYHLKNSQRLGGAYQNIGFETTDFQVGDANCMPSGSGYTAIVNEGSLKHGDELLINNPSSQSIEQIQWVNEVVKDTNEVECGTYLPLLLSHNLVFCSGANGRSFGGSKRILNSTDVAEVKIYHMNEADVNFINNKTDTISNPSLSLGFFNDVASNSFCNSFDTIISTATIFGNGYYPHQSLNPIQDFPLGLLFDFNDPIKAQFDRILSYDIYDDYEMTVHIDDVDLLFQGTEFATGNGIFQASYTEDYSFATHYYYLPKKGINKYLKPNQLFLVQYVFEDPLIDDQYFIDWMSPDYLPKDTLVETPQYDCQSNIYINDRQDISLNPNGESGKVIRSGYKNILTSSSGTVVSSSNPILTDENNRYLGINTNPNELKIYQANFSTYKDSIQLVRNYNSLVQNKFLNGEEGYFSIDSTFYYEASRHQKATIENAKDGYFERLPTLWTKGECNRYFDQISTSISEDSYGWHFANKVSKYDGKGEPAESVNSVGIYSSKLNDFRGNPQMIAANSKINNMATESFEDYFNFSVVDAYISPNFRLVSTSGFESSNQVFTIKDQNWFYETYPSLNKLIKGIAHTGSSSLYVKGSNDQGSNSITINYEEGYIIPLSQYQLGELPAINTKSVSLDYSSSYESHLETFKSNYSAQIGNGIDLINATNGTEEHTFNLPANEVNGLFDPESGNYLISVWVKEPVSSNTPYKGASPKIEIINGTSVVILKGSGPFIDGWQRIEGTFTYDKSQSLEIVFKGGLWGAFYDDFRIIPTQANANTYIYDFTNNRLKAKLDENNYATFFEYDKEGIPTQVKRETDRGIITISESRQGLQKSTHLIK